MLKEKLAQEFSQPRVRLVTMIAVALLLWSIVLAPWLQWRSDFSNRAVMLKTNLYSKASLDSSIESLNAASEELLTLVEDKRSLLKSPYIEPALELPADLRLLSERFQGVTLDKFAVKSLGTLAGAPYLAKYEVQFVAKGNADEIFSFMALLESPEQRYEVSRVAFFGPNPNFVYARFWLFKRFVESESDGIASRRGDAA